jgi:uncharacterized protein (TIGR02391 family)
LYYGNVLGSILPPVHTESMAAVDPLPPEVLRRICTIIGDTENGLTGREIARLLDDARIDDPGEMTKKDRLYVALSNRQRKDGVSNAVLACIQLALSPARFLSSPESFDGWRHQVNEALSFAGLMVDESGKVTRLAKAASTLSEARARANRFKEALRDRNVHHLVIVGCASEIDDENYFHAVFETTKSLADRIRTMSGLSEDGVTLVDRALGRPSGGLPVLALNSLTTRTEQSEHDGYANMVRGLFGAFRNTTAHRPKVTWPISAQDALDMMTTASLLHRRLDNAVEVPAHLRGTSS